MDNVIGYFLQIITITATVVLGLYTAIQSKKLQKGQHIVSVTTNYRLQRSEHIKQCGTILLSNSLPELLDESKEKAYIMLQKSHEASCQLSEILHRCFNQDMELITLSEKINDLVFEYIKGVYLGKDIDITETRRKLIGFRKVFIIKCDMYTYAEWRRIKKETSGIDTMSEEWIEFYKELSNKYNEELERVYKEYKLTEEI